MFLKSWNSRFAIGSLFAAGVLIAGLSLSAINAKESVKEPEGNGGPLRVRLLTQAQYANVITDVFGADIRVPTQFPAIPRTNGLLALGSTTVGMTPGIVEQFHRNANAVSAQIIAPTRRDYLFPCAPQSPSAADANCARAFLESTGRLLYRHPLADGELDNLVTVAGEAADKLHDFYAGISFALSAMLVSPQFFYIVEKAEADPSRPGHQRLDDYSFAARLSFMLWNSAPDHMLLQAAEQGELHTDRGLARQLDRMLASSRVENGMRAFFSDMLAFNEFKTLAKDAVIYPAFVSQAAVDAEEQALKTLTYHLLQKQGDYRDLFTSRTTFISQSLGPLYQVPVNDDGWIQHELPQDSGRAGFLTQIGFLSVHSHPGRSSPTRRGRAIRELLLCQKVPDPPPNVDFSLFEDPKGNFRTARERLDAHATNPVCAGCHRITDPIGLSLENFDGAGQFRKTEGGENIDASGKLGSVSFTDAVGLGQALHNDPAITSCVTRRLYAYSTGRQPSAEEDVVVSYLNDRFAASGYRIKELMRAVASSAAFSRVSENGAATEEKVTLKQ